GTLPGWLFGPWRLAFGSPVAGGPTSRKIFLGCLSLPSLKPGGDCAFSRRGLLAPGSLSRNPSRGLAHWKGGRFMLVKQSVLRGQSLVSAFSLAQCKVRSYRLQPGVPTG